MGGASVVNVVATGASAPERRQRLWRGGRQRGDAGSPRLFTPAAAELLLVPPTGLSIISDIDDTVKLSDVLNKRELLRNTFLREFVPVDGMATLYKHWEEQHDAVFHYVSASPWQLQPELEGFLRSSGFPPATFHLKSVRVNALPGSGDSLLNLLEKGASFKPRHIEVRLALWQLTASQDNARLQISCREVTPRHVLLASVISARTCTPATLHVMRNCGALAYLVFCAVGWPVNCSN